MANDKVQPEQTQPKLSRLELHTAFITEHQRHLRPLQRCVWLTLWDYASKDGHAWPGTETLSEVLDTFDTSIRLTIRELIALGYLEKPSRENRRNRFEYIITLPINPKVKQKKIFRSQNRRNSSAKRKKIFHDTEENLPFADPTLHITEPTTEQTKEQTSARGVRRWSDDEIESIWKVYPNRKGKKRGVQAMRKALDRIAKRNTPNPVQWLRERVEAYALAMAGTEEQFIKWPQGFFNDERYDDDFTIPKGRNHATSRNRNRFDGSNGEIPEPELTL